MELRQYNTILPSMITLITKRNREILEGLSRHVPSYAQLLTGEFNGIAIRLYGSTVNMQMHCRVLVKLASSQLTAELALITSR